MKMKEAQMKIQNKNTTEMQKLKKQNTELKKDHDETKTRTEFLEKKLSEALKSKMTLSQKNRKQSEATEKALSVQDKLKFLNNKNLELQKEFEYKNQQVFDLLHQLELFKIDGDKVNQIILDLQADNEHGKKQIAFLKDQIKENQDTVGELQTPLDNIQSVQKFTDLPYGASRKHIGDNSQDSTTSLFVYKQPPPVGTEKYETALQKYKQIAENYKKQMEEQRL